MTTTTTAPAAPASPRTARLVVAAVVAVLTLVGVVMLVSGGGSSAPGWSSAQTQAGMRVFEARGYPPPRARCIMRHVQHIYKSADAYKAADPGGRAVIVLAALEACP